MWSWPRVNKKIKIAFRVGFYNSKFGVTFSKLSLVSGDGGLFFLPRIVGYAKALEMSLTGDIYNGEECFKMGLLNTYAEKKEDLLPKTEKLINKILSNGPVSQSMIKRALKHSTKGDLNSCLDLNSNPFLAYDDETFKALLDGDSISS